MKTAKRDISGLKAQELIEFVGSPKKGFYRIKQQTGRDSDKGTRNMGFGEKQTGVETLKQDRHKADKLYYAEVFPESLAKDLQYQG